MNQLTDISKEEMEVFMQEADEQLQMLDEDLIALEHSDDQEKILQEIFRAAHTLKGSSGMLGYTDMSKVAHAMEAILDKLRNNEMSVSSDLIDSLLHGLDTLKMLKDALFSGEYDEAEVAAVIAELGEKVNGGAAAGGAAAGKAALGLSEEEIKTAGAEGDDSQKIFAIKVEVAPDCAFAAVRLFQVMAELGQLGKVIKSAPSQAELEAGDTAMSLEAFLAASSDADVIKAAIASVTDLKDTTVAEYEPPRAEQKAAKAVTEAAGESGARPAATGKTAATAQTVRIDVKLLDRLMDLIGEMVIDRNRIGQISRSLRTKYQGDVTVDALNEATAHISGIVSDLQDNILEARMLPVATVFNTFPRLVRDVAQKAGKKIDFIVTGQETELDRSIIEQIRDPLMHLLRNAIDHGVEAPEQRLDCGKAETGTVRLSAYQEDNYIIISVADDGGGINVEKLKASVVGKGIISAAEADILPEQEVLNLIFRAGVSTAAKVTDISGRGVGMDVVKTNIESLGGSIIINSAVGKGTEFLIKLPLTLATISGLLVSSGKNIYIIPTTSMVEVVQVKADDVKHVLGREVMRSRDHTIPLLRLDHVFGLQEEAASQGQDAVVVVVKAGENNAGITVGSVIEPQETVVKPLGNYLGDISGITGATILGDGRVALILDTAALVRTNINN